MRRPALALGMALLGIAGCSVHRTVVVAAADACTRYGFTASTADYIRCQQLIAEQRRAGRVATGYSEAQIVVDSQQACASYGVPRGTAQFDRCVQDEFAARRPG